MTTKLGVAFALVFLLLTQAISPVHAAGLPDNRLKTAGTMWVTGPSSIKSQAVYWWIEGFSISYQPMPDGVAVYYMNGDNASDIGEYATTYVVIINTAAIPQSATLTLRNLDGAVLNTLPVNLPAFGSTWMDITPLLTQ